MSVEDRREHILDVAIPLLLDNGVDLPTRQIADAAGIAEGTLFRAFEDKNALIDAALARVMDPADILEQLEQIDRELPLEDKVARIVELLHERVQRVVRFMSVLGPRDHARHHGGQPHRRPPLEESTGVALRLLEPHRKELRVDPKDAVDYLRVLVFGTSMPFLRSGREITPAELSDFILRGVAKEGH